MNLTQTVKNIKVGTPAHFDLSSYDTLTTICSRLKRNGYGVFKVCALPDKITVHRLAEASPRPSSLSDIKYARLLKEAIDDLDWSVLQSDTLRETYCISVVITRPGGSKKINIPVRNDFRQVGEAIVNALRDNLKTLAPACTVQ